jgi:hypothetical protein
MKKTKKLVVVLVLTLGCSASYAQDKTQETMHQYIRSVAISSSPVPNQHDSMKTIITVYSLIISAYVLYWFRQKI